ncbi:MAG: GlsB/YeaQ/YmgE family stress response membrane protein [Candidatus Eremiobacteraeota bacterium]|nr:GlsB/YeaQ/YmgE family stress response membrane protein [Candidatus Eremiobacteraeota bacterium]
MGIISWIVVGIIAGFLAKVVMKGEGPGGILGDLVIGVVGAILGGWIWNFFGHVGATGINLPSIIVAFVGALILLFILRSIGGRRTV